MSIAIAVLSLVFAVASFWWLNARRGQLQVVRPRSYAFSKRVRLRLPLAFFNTGAAALVVADLQLLIDDEPPLVLRWETTRSLLRPDDDGGFRFPDSVLGQGQSVSGSHRRVRRRARVVAFARNALPSPPADAGASVGRLKRRARVRLVDAAD
jgi:hypothetical protein